MTTQLFVASTAFGVATLVAALDDGAFAVADRRVLLLSTNAPVPETANRVTDVPGLDALCARFHDVYDYNEAIAPQHPGLWRPRAADLPILERYLTARWSLAGDLHLVLESIQVSPALALAQIFADARIDVYADGLMSYGPTRVRLPPLVASRIERLLHLDLVPGLTPVLLSEHRVPAEVVSGDAFRRVVSTLPPAPDVVRDGPPRSLAVLLGQYLAALGVLSPQEETELHVEMVRGAVAAGFDRVVFKPHPGAPPLLAEPLHAEAARLGATLTVHDEPELVERWLTSEAVGCVLGCFSTALLTAATLYGVPVARVGTELLLERLRPYQNSNRVPVTIADALVPPPAALPAGPLPAGPLPADPAATPAGGDAAAGTIGPLVRAVSYCMQPERYPWLRADTEALLRERWPELRRYFKRRRLTLLDLPGRLPARPAPALPTVPTTVRRRPLRAAARRLLGPTLTRRLRRLLDS